MATHSSILVWRIPIDRGAWWATVHGIAESDTTDQLSTAMRKSFILMPIPPFTQSLGGSQLADVETLPM